MHIELSINSSSWKYKQTVCGVCVAILPTIENKFKRRDDWCVRPIPNHMSSESYVTFFEFFLRNFFCCVKKYFSRFKFFSVYFTTGKRWVRSTDHNSSRATKKGMAMPWQTKMPKKLACCGTRILRPWQLRFINQPQVFTVVSQRRIQ